MNLVVDVGNTRMKYAFFDEDTFVGNGVQVERLFEEAGCWKNKGAGIHVLLSGSGRITEEIRLLLKGLSTSFREASSLMELPLELGYATPETLGFDRIAVCVGAMGECPGSSLLVIDSGTCITYNYVDADGVFRGGNISPGLEMRFRSLHQYTSKLPLVSPSGQYGEVGRTTEDAIRNGVMSGMLFEINHYIECFRKTEEKAEIFITGGNSCFLEGKVAPGARFCPILGLKGLNRILQYTKKNN